MITLRNVSKSFGAQTLFENASLQINSGDRFALVGPNGAGKSTLFKMIMELEGPDDGEISLRGGITFGYLPQETASLSDQTVIDEVLSGDHSDNRKEAQAKKILMGLEFKVNDFDRPANQLSGGWQMRVLIAKLLLQEPNLLMLDEPTNHLDLEALLWFQNHLQNYKGSLFLISHDREFINSVTNRIVELGGGRLKIYNGSFENYLEQKKNEEENLIKAYHLQQKEIEELEEYITRFRAKASLAKSVQSKIKYLERMEKIELPEEQKTVGFSFPQPTRTGQNALVLKDIRQSYDGVHWVYDGLNLTLERGQKIALVGPNGAGKSTLLKLLSSHLPFQSGERKPGINVEVGYFSQHRADMFKAGRTVFQEAADTRRAHSETTIRTVLGSFLFRGDAAFKKIEVLSGGEKSRLGLAKLLLDPPNVLLMDEPTTHLDIASVQVLVQALKSFEGTIALISHDVYFIRQIANHVIHVNQGKITWYPGDYDYFLHKKSLEEGEEAELFRPPSSPHAVGGDPVVNRSLDPRQRHSGMTVDADSGMMTQVGFKSKDQKRQEAEDRNARYKEKQQKKMLQVKRESLEEEISDIMKEFANPKTHQNPSHVAELAKKLGELKKRLEQVQ